jgi:hypothetical protein
MARRGSLAGLVVLVSVVASAGTVAAEETYVGTVAIAGATPPSAPLKLTIREYTSDDRAFALAERLHKGGPGAALAELAKGDAGTVQLGEQSFRATMIRQQKTDTGRIVRVVLDRPVQAAAAKSAAKPPADTVGYLELQLGASGEGSGKVMTAVKAAFDAEGWVVPESLGETWPVASVKPGP